MHIEVKTGKQKIGEVLSKRRLRHRLMKLPRIVLGGGEKREGEGSYFIVSESLANRVREVEVVEGRETTAPHKILR